MEFELKHLEEAKTRKELIAIAKKNKISISKTLDKIK